MKKLKRFIKSFKLCYWGIWFYYKGDEVLWKWPWRGGSRFVSLLASGTGEFGDAGFNSLRELDKFWENI